MLKLEKRLEAYGFEVVVARRPEDEAPDERPALHAAAEGDEDAQLCFELERPPPRLRAVRRHPAI